MEKAEKRAFKQFLTLLVLVIGLGIVMGITRCLIHNTNITFIQAVIFAEGGGFLVIIGTFLLFYSVMPGKDVKRKRRKHEHGNRAL